MKKVFLIIISFIVIVFFNSCKKIPDSAPVRDLRDGLNYSVAQLRAIATATVSNCCPNTRITYQAYLKGVVLADEVSGNFYKELYVRDAANTGAIHFTFLLTGSDLFIGDSVRLNLKGYDVNINSITGLLEIDSVDFKNNVVKYASGANPQPKQINLSAVNFPSYYGELVSISGVGFIPADTNQIYADPIKQLAINRTIQDCGLNQLVVRTSNYALFCQQKTPKGYGTITGIASSYYGTNQIAIRSNTEVIMAGGGCTVYDKKNFDDNSLTSGGWTQQSVINGSVLWAVSTYSGQTFAEISGYISGNVNSENWLISPTLNLSSATNPILTFQTAAKYAGNNLEVWVSSNYVSGAPNTAIWTQISGFVLSPNNPGTYAWTPSGIVSLNAFKTATTRIAFKYTSTVSGSTTYEVDDIIIREN